MWRKVARFGQTSLILVLASWNQGEEKIAILSGKIGELLFDLITGLPGPPVPSHLNPQMVDRSQSMVELKGCT